MLEVNFSYAPYISPSQTELASHLNQEESLPEMHTRVQE